MILNFLRQGLEEIAGEDTSNNIKTEGSLPSDSNGMVIEDVFTISGRGTVVTGIVKGQLSMNQSVVIERANRESLSSVIIGIEAMHKQLDCAYEGDNCGIILRGIERDQVARGDVIKVVQ